MKITKATLQKIAHLARLDIAPEKEDQIKKDLEQIVTWVQKLDELKLDDEAEAYHSKIQEASTLRIDRVQPTLSHEQALKNAPARDGRFFKVPNIMK